MEEIQEINPKYSRLNGCEEIPIDEIIADLPEWTHCTYYKENGHLPSNLPLSTEDGRRLVWLDLEEDVRMHFPSDPVATLSYRSVVIHFRSWDHLKTLRASIEDKLRNVNSYPGYERYLQMIPTRFLRARDRSKVIKLLDRLLECS